MENKVSTELLAPAGSYESLRAAICAGADAVYVGGVSFGARAYANNLTEEEMIDAIQKVHLKGCKLYLTVNTLLKEKELEKQLYEYLLPFYREGLDAVIVQDLGVLQFIRTHFPGLAIHASTQMTITGVDGARMLSELGASRIVTARELSLSEIKEIHKIVDIEIESFVHGALCYSYSGQCLFSSILGGRSGNRGRCAQPCRLPYQTEMFPGKEAYLLSPRDLCTIGKLPQIIESGVYSLKIEGRMKKPEYTAGVVSIYRKYLDFYLEGKKDISVSKEDQAHLFELYNRGTFTQGYYFQHNGRDMMFFEGRTKENEKSIAFSEEIKKDYVGRIPKTSLKGHVTIRKGLPAEIETEVHIKGNRYVFSVKGEIAAKAQKQPLTIETIQKQIGKTGNTPFEFSSLTVDTDGESFLSVTSLNELRRKGLSGLMGCIRETYLRGDAKEKQSAVKCEKNRTMPYRMYALLEKKEYFKALLPLKGFEGFYLDSMEYDIEDVKYAVKAAGDKKIYYALPHIFRRQARNWLEEQYEELTASGIEGFLVRNLEEAAYLKQKNCPLSIRLDFSVYTFNSQALSLLSDHSGMEMHTLPLELNAGELRSLADDRSELLVYGYLPMMLSAQCIRKNTDYCKKEEGLLSIRDRYKNEFPVKNVCRFCYNKIYNCKPLSLLTLKKEVDELGPSCIRLDFTIETVKEAVQAAKSFTSAYLEGQEYQKEPWEFTRGHFKRGVE